VAFGACVTAVDPVLANLQRELGLIRVSVSMGEYRPNDPSSSESLQEIVVSGSRDSTVGGTFQRPSFFDAYFDRVGRMLYGMADSFSAGVDLGLQAKASVTLPLNIKGEAGVGNHNWNLTLTAAGIFAAVSNPPIPHDLLYGEASLALGPIKFGGSTGSITEGLSSRSGAFVTVEEGFRGSARARGWTNDVRKDRCPPANRSGCKSRVGSTQVLQSN